MPLAVDTSQGKRMFFYDRSTYHENLAKNNLAPVKLSQFAQPISFFYTRNCLSANNVINKVNAPLAEPNTFTLDLIKFLGSKFDIYAYERNPESNKKEERYIVDVVCQAKSKDDWMSFSKVLKASPLGADCLYFESTNEIVIRGVNMDAAKAYDFIRECCRSVTHKT